MLSITRTSDIDNGLCFSLMDIKPTVLPFFKEYTPLLSLLFHPESYSIMCIFIYIEIYLISL